MGTAKDFTTNRITISNCIFNLKYLTEGNMDIRAKRKLKNKNNFNMKSHHLVHKLYMLTPLHIVFYYFAYEWFQFHLFM